MGRAGGMGCAELGNEPEACLQGVVKWAGLGCFL